MSPVPRYDASFIPAAKIKGRKSDRSGWSLTGISSALLLLIVFALVPLPRLCAQDTTEALRQKVEQQYPLTKPTAGKDDIVTAGAVLVLQKDNLEMSSVSSPSPAQNTYKGGKIAPNFGTQMLKMNRLCTFCGHSDKTGTTRTFVAGEKFWLTKVEVHDDAVILSFFSDPISDVRYISTLKFPYTKSSSIPSEQILASIGEVLKVQPSGDAKAEPPPQQTPPPPAAPPAPAMAVIAPPPPPPDAAPAEPKSVKLGQTRSVVVANFGQPTKVLDKGATKIYVYPDMKVTFGKTDKVIDVE